MTRMSSSGYENRDHSPARSAFWFASATANGVHAEIEARDRLDLGELRDSMRYRSVGSRRPRWLAGCSIA